AAQVLEASSHAAPDVEREARLEAAELPAIGPLNVEQLLPARGLEAFESLRVRRLGGGGDAIPVVTQIAIGARTLTRPRLPHRHGGPRYLLAFRLLAFRLLAFRPPRCPHRSRPCPKGNRSC